MREGQKSGESSIRLLVADGSRIHTQLIVEALRRDPDLSVAPYEFNTSTLADSVHSQNIDVLILSSTLDEQPGRGFEVLRELRSAAPRLRSVMLLDSSTDEAVVLAFRAGARGVLSKSEPAHILNQCIRRVHEGQIWANSQQLTVAIEALSNAPAVRAVNARGMSLLSKRELQVVRSLAEGLTNREIAARLKLSQHTVKNYLFRVFDKLGVSSRVELLFMTLAETEAQPAPKTAKRTLNGAAGEEFAQFLKAASAGTPIPQLALAEMYSSLQQKPQDLVAAYAWYLLANKSVIEVKEKMTNSMTSKQVEEAQQRANRWAETLRSLNLVGENTSAESTPANHSMKTKGAHSSS